MSGRPGLNQKRFSHDKFQILPDSKMANSHDATIDIPLTTIPSQNQTGARKADSNAVSSSYVPPNEAGAQPGAENRGLTSGRRAIGLHNGKDAESPEDGTITRMGRFYDKILHFSVITRYFLYVLPLALMIAIPIIIGATAAPNAKIGGVRIVWFFTWIEIVWLSLWVSKIIAHYIPFVFQFLCGIVSSGTRKYALILKSLEIPLSLVGWSVTSLATFIPLMTKNPDQPDSSVKGWQDVVRNILFAAFVSTLILAAEKVLIQLISISYHRKQFDLKIQESKRNIFLIGKLYEASRKMFPVYCPEFEAEDYVINDSIIGIGKKGKSHTGMGSVSPMRLIQNVGQNVGRVGDKIGAAFGHVAHEITGKKVFDSSSAHSIVILALEKRKSSEALARRLWMSFVLSGRDALYIDDLYDVFGAGHRDEADECFSALDRDDNGDISLDEMVLTVTEFGTARDSISKSMHDVDQAIHVLDNLLCTVVFILVVLVFVAFLNSGFGTTLAAGATALLSLSFVFATTAQEVLGSCIFLFVKHPYDVGDRVDINGNRLVVEHISLLFTAFRNVGDHKTVQVPNIVLNTNWVENVTRSKAMREQLTLTTDFGTSFGDIQLLKNEMQKFVRQKDNSRDFQPDVDIEVTGLGEMSKLELLVEIRHKSNWHNESVRATRRSKFMCALVLAVRRVPIYGPGGGDAVLGDIGNASYSVAISHEQAQAGKDDFAAGKEKARMVPTADMEDEAPPPPSPADDKPAASGNDSPGRSGSGLHYRGAAAAAATATNNESYFADSLNARPPAMDQSRADESDVLHVTDDTKPLIRGPSTGRRKASDAPQVYVSPNTPVEGPSTTASPTTATAPSARRPVEYHEYTFQQQQQQQQPRSGRESPYQSNNPYARSSPTPTSSPQPGYQSPPSRIATPPASMQNPSSRRPVPGNNPPYPHHPQPPPQL